jgi:type IV pilus assembly protein PilN
MRLNLLPHREARRRHRRQRLQRTLAAAAALGLLAALLGYAVLQQRTAAQQQRNELLAAEIGTLEASLQALARQRNDISALQARVQALQVPWREGPRPARLLEALARHTPEGVQLTSLRQHADGFTLGGVALGSAEVEALVRNLGQAGELLLPSALVELKAAAPAGRDAPRRFDFTLELRPRPVPLAAGTSAATAALDAATTATAISVTGVGSDAAAAAAAPGGRAAPAGTAVPAVSSASSASSAVSAVSAVPVVPLSPPLAPVQATGSAVLGALPQRPPARASGVAF